MSRGTTPTRSGRAGTCARAARARARCTARAASPRPSGRCRWGRASTPTRRIRVHGHERLRDVRQARPDLHERARLRDRGRPEPRATSCRSTIDGQGAAVVSYVFDTSAGQLGRRGRGARGHQPADQRPEPARLRGHRSRQGGGPGRPMGSVTDPRRDAVYSANGTAAPPPAQPRPDRRVARQRAQTNTLVATIHVRSLASLAVSPTLGGPDAQLGASAGPIVRPGKTARGAATATSTTRAWTTMPGRAAGQADLLRRRHRGGPARRQRGRPHQVHDVPADQRGSAPRRRPTTPRPG